MEVPISNKTIELLRGFSTSLVSAGIIQQEELTQLWSIAKKSQDAHPPEPLILVSRAKAAKMLNISARSLDRLIKQGALPCVRVGKRAVRIEQRKIELFVKENSGRMCTL